MRMTWLAPAVLVAVAVTMETGRANTPLTVVSGQTDLTAPTTYTPAEAPTASSDIVWSGAYAPSTMIVDVAGGSFTVGTLNNLSTTALTVSTSSASTLVLAGGVNSAPGASPNDVVSTTSGTTTTIAGSVALASLGNFNVAGGGLLSISAIVGGTGGFTKTGTGTLQLNAKNTFTGGCTIAQGAVLVNTNADAATLANTLGAGPLTMLDGVTLSRPTGGSTSNVFNTVLNLAGNVTIGTVTTAVTPARIRYNGILDMGGQSRTMALAQGAATISDGSEQFSFYTTGGLAYPSVQNGTVAFQAGAGASGTAPAQVRITSTTAFTGNAGLTIGANVLLRVTTTNTTSAVVSPRLTVNGLAYLGEGTSSRSMNVFSLSGTGLITDPVLSTFTSGTATLIIDGSAAATFAGQVTDGSDQQVLQSSGWGAGYGTMAVTKRGTGTQVFTGANTYAGITRVEAGTLLVNGDQSLASGTVTVYSAATLGGTGTVGGATTITTGATLAPGVAVGTLTIAQDLTWNGNGAYNWQMLSGTGTAGAANAWDLVTASGSLSITASATNQFQLDLWTLAPGGTSGPAANFNSAQNYTWKILSAAGGISGFSAEKFLINTSATNGTGGFANGLSGGTFSLAQSGNDLNLVFTAAAGPTAITINVASGTQTQAQAGQAMLSGTLPVVKTGAGTLVVDQPNTLTGSTTVQGGALQLANGSALVSSRIVPLAGGTVTLAPALQTIVGGLAANAGGLTDVGNGMTTVSAGLPVADMLTALQSGRGDGSWTGTSGITSSVVAADVAQSIPRNVGWVDNGDGSVAFAFAASGDTNLDWQVDLLDAANFLAGGKFDTGLPASWIEGDFGYDGVVDLLDAADFVSTGLYDVGSYNSASGASPPPEGAGFREATSAVAAVPEPVTLLPLVVGVGWVMIRAARRRGECEAALRVVACGLAGRGSPVLRHAPGGAVSSCRRGGFCAGRLPCAAGSTSTSRKTRCCS